MYRVELKAIYVYNGIGRVKVVFLMYRVELKGGKRRWNLSIHIKFLMYRVELKVSVEKFFP